MGATQIHPTATEHGGESREGDGRQPRLKHARVVLMGWDRDDAWGFAAEPSRAAVRAEHLAARLPGVIGRSGASGSPGFR